MNNFKIDGFEIRVIRDPSEQQRSEQNLLAAGIALPLAHRCAWMHGNFSGQPWFVEIRNNRGEPRGGFAVDAIRSRAIPGHIFLRCERFGEGLAPEAMEAGVKTLLQLAQNGHRVLRLNIETFAWEEKIRMALNSTFKHMGFEHVPQGRRYGRTLALDLGRDEPAIFADFHSTARKNVRAIKRHPLEIRPIQDARWAPRMEAIMRETMRRTAGEYRKTNWHTRIQIMNEDPTLATLLGLFRTDMEGDDSLLAFSSCHLNGTYAHYDCAGSTRDTDLKVSLNYALLWELICWSKRNGAKTFDFGGITAGHAADRLSGISDFKRYFTENEVEVGGEWMIEPRWMRARFAKAANVLVSWLSFLKSRIPYRAVPLIGILDWDGLLDLSDALDVFA